jgi:hypothetical protein
MTAPKHINDPTAGHVKPIRAARLLHVNPRTIQRWLEEEDHPKFPNAWQTASGRWWIPLSDLEGWRIPCST